MKILIIGSNGQLGWELQQVFQPLGQVVPIDYPEIDLRDPDSISHWIRNHKPKIIANAAAYTNVDQAETEIELAWAINSVAPGIIAQEALLSQSIFVHYSTDFVFDGTKGQSYSEKDLPAPINVYGESKLAGERAIENVGGKYFILRTSWLYSTHHESFVTKVLKWARKNEQMRIVADQIGSPTWSRSLADATAEALIFMESTGKSWQEENSGIYHVAGNGSVSRYDWAKTILNFDPKKNEHIVTQFERAISDDFNTPAQRPMNSGLDCSLFQKTFNSFKTDWKTNLAAALSD